MQLIIFFILNYFKYYFFLWEKIYLNKYFNYN